MEKPWALSYPLSAQRRLIRLVGYPGWSESSLGAHSFCWFCLVVTQIEMSRNRTYKTYKMTCAFSEDADEPHSPIRVFAWWRTTKTGRTVRLRRLIFVWFIGFVVLQLECVVKHELHLVQICQQLLSGFSSLDIKVVSKLWVGAWV